MTAIIKEETRMEEHTKTYLEMYQEFLEGYKQYKMEKDASYTKTAKAERLAD